MIVKPKRASLAWPDIPAPQFGPTGTPKRDTSGWVDPDPDPEETDEPATPDVIAMLGFDPDALDWDDDPEAGKDTTPPFAANRLPPSKLAKLLKELDAIALDSDWEESKHKRGQPGNAGQFGSGGGGGKKPLPAPSTHGNVKAKNQAKALAVKHLTEGTHPDQIAQALKDHAAQHDHPSVANYANKLLEHIAQAHGVSAQSLGKAVPKGKGPSVPVSAKPVPPPPKPAPEPPKPAPQPEPPKPQSGKSAGPEPHPDSPLQKEIYEIATGLGPDDAKVIGIKQAIETALATGKTMASGMSPKFADAWVTALGGTPDAPDQPSSAPPVEPQTSSGATRGHTNVLQAPPKRLVRAQKLWDAAQKMPSAFTAESRQIAPSLSKDYWSTVPPQVRSIAKNYSGGGSGGLNTALRNPAKMGKEKVAEAVAMDELFEDAEAELTEDVVLHRGEDVPAAEVEAWREKLAHGAPVAYMKTGFVSTSMGPKAAFEHLPVQFHMVARKGTRAVGLAAISGLPHENEVLLRHGQAFEIYEISEYHGQTHVKMVSK